MKKIKLKNTLKIRLGFLLLVTILMNGISFSAFSQMKIASTPGVPNSGAMLDVESNNRGFLPPRVYLTSLTMLLNNTVPLDGTIIFSLNWSGDERLGGLFIWRATQWVSLDASTKLPISHIRVMKNVQQGLVFGNNDLSWDMISDVQQPDGDLPMWSAVNPTKVIIRRKGWYAVSGSCRMDMVLVGDPRYLAITHKGQQVTGAGFNNPGNSGTRNDVTLNTSTVIFCEVNDEIALMSYVVTNSNATPVALSTTQLSVTQLPNYTF
ncbi:MAG: hypothetical protein EOO85_01235 [Pedobacter sp.]|nr:MAG: hypothetical protein EOO85_01235 [Pedobacter sp.]